jgi:hypothetical protein
LAKELEVEFATGVKGEDGFRESYSKGAGDDEEEEGEG